VFQIVTVMWDGAYKYFLYYFTDCLHQGANNMTLSS